MSIQTISIFHPLIFHRQRRKPQQPLHNLSRRQGREAGGGGIPCGGSPVCLLKKAAKTGSSEGFQARAQSAHGRKIIKISSGVGAVPCFCRLFELAGQASGTRNPTPVRLPPLSPGTKQGRGCVPPQSPASSNPIFPLTPPSSYTQPQSP